MNIPRTCKPCDVTVFDVPIRGANGSGYANPTHCPLCGQELTESAVTWKRKARP